MRRPPRLNGQRFLTSIVIDFLNRITMRRFALACLFLSFALGVRGIYAQTPQTPQAPTASMRSGFGEKIQIKHVPNAGRISEHLYRGAQPKPGGLEQLQALHITTIVDLRSEDSATRDREQKEAEARGIHFVSIPVGEFSPPTGAQVALFLSLFGEDSKETVFVHCQYGKDRTGVFIATYRMGIQKWTAEQALNEMYFFGFNRSWHPEMISFVREFPSLLSSDPALQSLSRSKP
ncbi:MAG TPA: tyrosine-protein phosphatase [Methylomirabilota bacterium]|nr:tyrosine-protein phosphatase [Methylomirabilota bacterium]